MMLTVTLDLPGLDAIGWPRLTHIEKLSIHHTAIAVPLPGGELDHVMAIHRYHASTQYDPAGNVTKQSWGGIGYHGLYVPTNRTLYLANADLTIPRAGVANRNRTTIHLCIAGNYMAEAPWPTAISDMAEAVRLLRRDVGIADLPLIAHRDWAVPEYPTACPGDTYATWLPQLEGDMTYDERERLAAIEEMLKATGVAQAQADEVDLLVSLRSTQIAMADIEQRIWDKILARYRAIWAPVDEPTG